MSSKTDRDSYPYSELLIQAINREEPGAMARPARAQNLQRCYDLFATNQMQFMLIPRSDTVDMFTSQGSFAATEPLPGKILYEFGDLILSVRDDVDANIVRTITFAILEQLESLPNASSPLAMLEVGNVHVDSLTAITTFLANS
jgi:hypothetical protein